MQKEILFFTAGQFAKLHRLNKRTLHYYDDIGLFSPAHKGENGYRYYTYHQSAELENILALRELGMSIEEIKTYMEHPSADRFLKIAGEKIGEIDRQIQHLKKLKALFQEKQASLALCGEVYHGKIQVVQRPKRFLLPTPLQTHEALSVNMPQIIAHLQNAWELSGYKTGCGSYLSLEKAKSGRFDAYDGVFTLVDNPKDAHILPEGEYLCGYCVGKWDKIPAVYGQMFDYAAERGMALWGDCYETGLNEFAIADMDSYVTLIEIRRI